MGEHLRATQIDLMGRCYPTRVLTAAVTTNLENSAQACVLPSNCHVSTQHRQTINTHQYLSLYELSVMPAITFDATELFAKKFLNNKKLSDITRHQ